MTAVIIYDAVALPVALYLALTLRLGAMWHSDWLDTTILLWALLQGSALVLTVSLRIPSMKISALDQRDYARIALLALALVVIGTLANLAANQWVPRTVPAIFGLLYFLLLFVGRITASELRANQRAVHPNQIRVAIYGAGSAGIQLNSAFRQSNEIKVVAFVDDNPNLQGIIVGGVKVGPPSQLSALAEQGRINRVLVAMPSAPQARRTEIMENLRELPCEVQMLPGYVDLLTNGGLVSGERSVTAADLLGRSEVDLDIPEIHAAFCGTVAMVTGAGGSIGSELCRQLIELQPRRVVLFDSSEFALFSIERELQPVAERYGIELCPVLGSVGDAARVAQTIAKHNVRTILHAAAYKHVPLVEANVLEGVQNNIFGTRILAEAARKGGVERFILVSTDKAVRPANIMGGTKRMAEIVIQDLQKRSPEIKFAMVRFGNVLGSSGSVVPIFREQIASGGPVTVTHPEMTRFFMTVPEAARLVLLAGSYAEGGEVYVLDMGQPVRIADMARRMIELSGLTVRDAHALEGDIEIVFTGIRPGEKLYEELLIGDNTLPTPHPKIKRAQEDCPTQIEVAGALQDLHGSVLANAPETARAVLTRYAMVQPGYVSPIPTKVAS